MATSMPSTANAQRSTTIVLMGKTGNGKSATGNSILGHKAFKSQHTLKAVTAECKKGLLTLPDGRVVHVIDTPGFFEASQSQEEIRKELIKCLELAKDGVHAVLLVLSIRNRFTAEEAKVIDDLKQLFGEAVMRHMILVFTAGDELLESERTLEEFLEESQIVPLNNLIDDCGNRKILFNNRTQDKEAKDKQVTELLQLVDKTVRRNGGTPYSNELFEAAKALAEKKEQAARELEELRDSKKKQELQAQFDRESADLLRAVNEQLDRQIQEIARRENGPTGLEFFSKIADALCRMM